MNRYVIWTFGVVIVALSVYFLLSGNGEDQSSFNENVTRTTETVSYQCADDLTMAAAFNQNIVVLSLLDGRQIVLQQVEAASGAKYANDNESLVFWTKGDEAFFEEFGTTSYADCVAL